jgi:TDG/mug DNA glycosylase family protein
MPNSSARCAQLPRAVDKVPFYAALKKFRDYLRGDIPELDESDVVFPEVKLQNFNNKRIKKEEFTDDMNPESENGEERIDPETGKKRRGRPPKPRPDGSLPAPKRRRVDEFGNPLPKGSNPIDPVTGKKKRGRPKKSDMVQHPAPALGPAPGLGLPNGLQSLVLKAKAAETFHSEEQEGESEAPLPGTGSVKTPTRLPPFSPHFGARGVKEEVEEGEEPGRLHSSIDGDEGHGLPKDLSRADSLPDLSGRLGDDPCSPPPSPMGKSLPPPEFEPPRSLHEEETSHSTEDRRPDSARSLTRPHIPCNFSAPTTPVDHSPHQGYPPQQRFSPFPRGAPHHSPSYPQGPPQGHPQGQQNFHAPYRGPPHLQGTPPHQNYDSPQPQHPPKSHHPSDLSTKSLTGLESLVDQIPAIAEADSGVFSSSGNGSHPATPRSVGPYSPGQYHGGSSYLPPTYSGPGYPGGQQGSQPGPGTPGSDSFPTDLSTSTNYGHPVATTASHSPSTPSNFSVSHLAHSSVRGGGEENGDATITGHGAPPPMSEAFSVSNLASSYASPVSSHGGGGPEEPPKYPPGISSNPYMSGHSSMFSPSLMTRSIGPPGGSFPSMGGMAGMAGMGAFAGMAGYGAMQASYGQYSAASAAAGAYTGAAQAFAAAAGGGTYHHGLPMPNPSYPYPSPYSQSPYSQSPYF